MKIVVLVKEVPDTYGERRLDPSTGLIDRADGDQVIDEIDERAAEIALQIKDRQKDTEVVLLAMGPDGVEKSLRKALGMGADRAILITDPALAASDALRTAHILAAALKAERPDLIVMGNQSTDGRGGVVPAAVAELLALPLLGSLESVAVEGGSVSGTQVAETATKHLSAPLPAVVSITEKAAEARFPGFMGIMKAKGKPIDKQSVASLDVAAPEAHTVVMSTAQRPPRSAGIKIVDEGDGGRQLAAWLLERNLVVRS